MNLGQFARRYAWPLWYWYAAGLVFLAATNLITLKIPMLAKDVINALRDNADLQPLARVTWIIIGLGTGQIIIRSLSRILIFWPGRSLEANARRDFFNKTMTLPMKFFGHFGMGDLISRLSNDLGQMRILFAFAALNLFNLTFLTIFTISQMAHVHLRLTLLCLLPVSLMVVLTRLVMPKLHVYSKLNQDALGRLTTRATEAFVNVHVIQANAAEGAFLARAETENQEVYRTNLKLVMVRTVLFPLMTALTGVGQLLVLGYGGYEVIHNRLTVGDIMAFNIYLGYLAFPLTSIGIVISIYKRAQTAMERLTVFEEADSESHLNTKSQLATNTQPLLEIKHLAFAYPESFDKQRSRAVAIEELSLAVRPGEKIGLYGPVGSGKTTIFRLLTRLYEPAPGQIFYAGQDITTLDPQVLRQNIGLALQSVHLFSDTIRENLTFGLEPPPSMAELERAARRAQVLDEIQNFDHQWATKIGEKGVRLSGGQRQRLALARLLLRNSPVLLLDDVLAAVDNHTEQRLIEEIFTPDKTIIVASHRLPVLRICDRVLYLKDGRVMDSGTFRELAARHPELKESEHDSASH